MNGVGRALRTVLKTSTAGGAGRSEPFWTRRARQERTPASTPFKESIQAFTLYIMSYRYIDCPLSHSFLCPRCTVTDTMRMPLEQDGGRGICGVGSGRKGMGGGVCVTGILDTPPVLRMDKVDKVGKVSGFVNLRGEDRRHGILSRGVPQRWHCLAVGGDRAAHAWQGRDLACGGLGCRAPQDGKGRCLLRDGRLSRLPRHVDICGASCQACPEPFWRETVPHDRPVST